MNEVDNAIKIINTICDITVWVIVGLIALFVVGLIIIAIIGILVDKSYRRKYYTPKNIIKYIKDHEND
jgi:hypothetical protein